METMVSSRTMKIKEYYKDAARSLFRAAVLTAKGTWMAVARLFRSYPNPTWAVITACVIMTAIVAIGKARSERDHYSNMNVRLQQQVDSLMNKQVKYTQWR